jgi:hypothetical protein
VNSPPSHYTVSKVVFQELADNGYVILMDDYAEGLTRDSSPDNLDETRQDSTIAILLSGSSSGNR